MFVEKQRIQAAIQRWSVGWDADWPDWGGALLLLHQANNTRTHTHTHTHTHTPSYITGQSSAQFTENSSSCLTKFSLPAFPSHTYTYLSLLLIRPHSFENKQSEEVSSLFLPALPPHTHKRARTHACTGKLLPSAGNSLYSKGEKESLCFTKRANSKLMYFIIKKSHIQLRLQNKTHHLHPITKLNNNQLNPNLSIHRRKADAEKCSMISEGAFADIEAVFKITQPSAL